MKILIIAMAFNILSCTFKENHNKVHATVYNATPQQTNSDPGHTAFMFELDLNNPYKHRIIAVSRDLLEKYPKGTNVYVAGTDYDGVYIVMDKMNMRYTNRIDLLINEDMKIGNWPNATITKEY
jgi:3D (Asp-Asp-Asp) domain-containing protein